ncbi:MAG: hypothetical protein KGS61_19365 [Verrucomicrobia bacterium]|nr:hypothetical protein [Verrucomicrobiota bacterium]
MPAVKSSEPIDYTGHWRHGVDDSRRVMIPARWRPRDPRVQLTLVPWPVGAEDRLLVLPPGRWREMLGRIRSKSLADPRVAALERVIGGTAIQQSLDKVGRICLPETMSTAVGLGKEVELVGRLDKFEIWDPRRYDALSAQDAKLAAEALKEMEL